MVAAVGQLAVWVACIVVIVVAFVVVSNLSLPSDTFAVVRKNLSAESCWAA